MDGRTDIFPPLILLGRLLEVDLKTQWISKETVKAMKGRTEAWREYVNNHCKSNYIKFVMICNKVNKMTWSDKESYNQRILNSFKGNPKNSTDT